MRYYLNVHFQGQRVKLVYPRLLTLQRIPQNFKFCVEIIPFFQPTYMMDGSNSSLVCRTSMVLSSALSPTMYACFSSVSPGNCPEHHFTVKTQHILLNAYPFIIHDPIILDNVTNAVEKARSNTLVSH